MAGGYNGALHRLLLSQRRALRPGHRDLEPPPATISHGRCVSHGHPAAQRQGPGGRGLITASAAWTSAELYDPATEILDRHRLPSTRRRDTTRPPCCPTARSWWPGAVGNSSLPGQRRALRPGHRDLEPPPAATVTTRPLTITRPPCCPTARSWWRGASDSTGHLSQRRALRPGQRDLDRHRHP